MGHPDEVISTFRILGDSILYRVSESRILTRRTTSNDWVTVLSSSTGFQLGTFDEEYCYVSIEDETYRIDHSTGEGMELPGMKIDLSKLHHQPGEGLYCSDPTGKYILRSVDQAITWDTILSVSNIPSIPDHSVLHKFTRDIRGNLFIIFKSNWQYHIIVIDEGRKPVELANSWFDYFNIIMDSDSTIFFEDKRGSHRQFRGEKYEEDLVFQLNGHSVSSVDLLYAEGDSIVFIDSRNTIYQRASDTAMAIKIIDFEDWGYRISWRWPNYLLFWGAEPHTLWNWMIYNVSTADTLKVGSSNGALFTSSGLFQLPGEQLIDIRQDRLSRYSDMGNWSTQSLEWTNPRITVFRDSLFLFGNNTMLRTRNYRDFDMGIMPDLQNKGSLKFSRIGDHQIWINTSDSTYKYFGNGRWESDILKPSIKEVISFDERKWLIYGGNSGRDTYWFTDDGGRSLQDGPAWKRPRDFLTTENGEHYLVLEAHDSIIFRQVDESLEIVKEVYLQVEDCYGVNAVPVSGDDILVMNDMDIYAMNLSTGDYYRVDETLPRPKNQVRKLERLENGAIYLSNFHDQIYLWEPSDPLRDKGKDQEIFITENPCPGQTSLILPLGNSMNFLVRVFDLRGQLVQEFNSHGKGLVPLVFDFPGVYLVTVSQNESLLGTVKVISR
jgi:hypothetical protein